MVDPGSPLQLQESGRRQRKVKELLWEGQLENWEEYDDLVDAIEYVLYATHVDRLEVRDIDTVILPGGIRVLLYRFTF